MDGERPYLAWAFGLPEFVIAILSLLGPRSGKALAVDALLDSLEI